MYKNDDKEIIIIAISFIILKTKQIKKKKNKKILTNIN